jgi:hypothetical protein
MSISPCLEMKVLADELAAVLKQREDLSANSDSAEMQANIEKVNERIAVHRAECAVCSRVFPQTVSDGPAIISS